MTFNLSFPVAISFIPLAIALLIIAVGVFLWRKKVKGAAIVVLVIGGLFAVVFGPMLFMDRVTVGPSGVHQTTGFWFSPIEKGFQFSGLERVLITTARDMKDREIEVWVAEYESGPPITVDPGDLWELNGDRIIAYMEERGIRVDRSTP